MEQDIMSALPGGSIADSNHGGLPRSANFPNINSACVACKKVDIAGTLLYAEVWIAKYSSCVVSLESNCYQPVINNSLIVFF